MYLFYMDDSGNTGTKLDLDQPIHWQVTVGVSFGKVRDIEKAMNNLAMSYFPNDALLPEFEFKGSEIFGGRNLCQSLTPAQRVELYVSLVDLIKLHDCNVFVRGIDKQKHHDRASEKVYDAEHPHKLACMYLCEDMDRWLEAQQKITASPMFGLLIADEQKEIGRDVVNLFASWRASGTYGYKGRPIRHFVDTIHYVPSKDSWLLQLVDCVAFARSKSYKVWMAKSNNFDSYTAGEAQIRALWLRCLKRAIVSRVWP